MHTFYKARPIDVHGPVIIMPARPITLKKQTRGKMKTVMWPEIFVSTSLLAFQSLLRKKSGTSFTRFEQHVHIIARRIRRHVRNLQGGS